MDFCLVVPDSHIPFEDRRAFELMLQLARSLRIRIVVILGDFLDCYGLSFYDKDPSFGDPADLYEREIMCANKRLDQIESLGAGKHVFLCGNHEYRLEKSLTKLVPAIRKRISICDELKLHRRPNYQWLSYSHHQAYEIPGTDIWCRHEPPAGGSVENIAKQSGSSVIYGHDHTPRQASFINKITGIEVIATGAGWLGDETQRAFNYVKRKPNWGLGFVLVSEHKTIHLIKIEQRGDRYLAVFGDKEYWG